MEESTFLPTPVNPPARNLTKICFTIYLTKQNLRISLDSFEKHRVSLHTQHQVDGWQVSNSHDRTNITESDGESISFPQQSTFQGHQYLFHLSVIKR